MCGREEFQLRRVPFVTPPRWAPWRAAPAWPRSPPLPSRAPSAREACSPCVSATVWGLGPGMTERSSSRSDSPAALSGRAEAGLPPRCMALPPTRVRGSASGRGKWTHRRPEPHLVWGGEDVRWGGLVTGRGRTPVSAPRQRRPLLTAQAVGGGGRSLSGFACRAPTKRINIYFWDPGRRPYGKDNGKV